MTELEADEMPAAQPEPRSEPASEPGPEVRAASDVSTRARPVIKAGNVDLYVEARGSFAEGDVAGYMPSPESDKLRVSLESFEGPLDLLLYLIEKHALDVFDIPIKMIVAEYMGALDDMRGFNLDVAGEFLMMAAQLAHMKSKMLLPREHRPKEAEPELDPRAALVRRLLEYQRFKDAAARLDALPALGRDVFVRPLAPVLYDAAVEEPVEDVRTALNLSGVDIFDLIRLLDQMLKRQQKLVIHEVLVERISVGARINELVDLFTTRRPERGFSFAELCDAFGPRTRRGVIVTFLSVLEMTRLKLIRVEQAETGAISILPMGENLRSSDAALGTVDEFDKRPEGAGEAL